MISVPCLKIPALPANTSGRVFIGPQKVSALAALCAVLSFTISGHAQQSLQVLHHHVRTAVSSREARLVGRVPATQRMQISIVLALRNQVGLTELLGQLYEPSSPNYRHFLSVDQFTEKFSPTAEDYQTVIDFAKANGFTVTATAANRMIVPISGSVAQIEKAFNLRMNNFRHPTENRIFYSPDREPSLHLSVSVAHIAGLNNFSIPRPAVIQASREHAPANIGAAGSGPGTSYLASDMRAAYYGGAALTGSGQTVGLLEFDGYYISDVNQTFSSVGQSYSVPINNVLLDGASGAPVSGVDAEETVDIVQAIGMAPGLSQVRVYIGSSDVDILNAMATEDIAKQLSISWLWSPDDPSTDDIFFQEFAAQGQSVFAASGDWGSYPSLIEPYYYPAEDAYVTAVGGTILTTSGAGGPWTSEVVWPDTGGGVSPDAIPIPSWQAGVANASNGGSTTLRNVPDVAAEADIDNYVCATPYGCENFGGTSLAAPRWAGFMALVNQQAAEANHPAAGFIDPAIYAIGAGSNYGSDLHDIVAGDNCIGGTPCYSAVAGYDLVTGWGSPNGQNLIDALAGPAAPGFTLAPSPSALAINPGAVGATTITVYDLGGFAGSVNLAISNLPSGVTASFSANPTTGTSVLTLTASATAATGTAYVTITGSSGTSLATATLACTVIPPPSITLSANPAALSVNQGVSGTTTVTVTDHYGFTGPVMLVASNLPNGVTGQWGTNPTSGTGVLSLTASPTAAIGTVTVTITGTASAVQSASTTLMLTVTPFTLADSPVGLIIPQGSSRTSTVTVNHTSGFTGSVTLAASGLPSGVTAQWGTNPTTRNSVLTLTTSATAALGITTVTITGSSPGVQSATTTLDLMVTANLIGTNEWAWMGGSNTVPISGGNPGVYGTLGAPAPGNIPGGRWQPLYWTDSSGHFWLFGGNGFDANGTLGLLNDLWEFDPSTNAWTWMGGSNTIPATSLNDGGNPGVYGTLAVPAAGNIPGSRDVDATWTDSSGNLWLFGGSGYDANGTLGLLNDLWVFNPSTDQWAWMGGSSTIPSSGGYPGVYGTLGVPAAGNIPGGRGVASTWTDMSGHLWLFGGGGFDANGNNGFLNDLWEFNPSTDEWTWMGGSSTFGSGDGRPGLYGVLGVPAAGNIPGGRDRASSWTDMNGHLWLFGGSGYDANDTGGFLNDLWEFNPSTNEWTWMGGSSTVPSSGGNPGVYGTLGVPAARNIPGGRYEAYSWVDSSGHFWLFGGYGFDVNDTWGGPNDLWEFSPSTSEWTWIGGSSTVPCSYCSIAGVYGTLGVPAAGSIPGSRGLSPNWTDNSGNLWLFGGSGYDANDNVGDLNDLWEYRFGTPGFTLSALPSGLSIVQGASSTSTITVSYVAGFSGGVTLAASGLPSGVTASFGTNPTTGNSALTLAAGSNAATGNVTVTVIGTSGSLTVTTSVALTVNPAPSFTLGASPASLTVTQGASGKSTITVTSLNGFAGKVTLADSGLPSGVTASFGTNPTTGTSVLTLAASNTAATGTYNVTITGTSGSLTATTTVVLTVTGFSCHIAYMIETQWPGGFEAAVTINNTGVRAMTSWTVTWTFANGQKITDIWDGKETQSGANVTVTNLNYNGFIPAGGSYTGLGFNGSWNNLKNAAPTSFAVNGTTCR